MTEANQEFHHSVWRAGHNDALIDVLARLETHLGRYPRTTLTYPGRWAGALAEHAKLIEAIEARDADRAEHLTRKHFEEARDIRLKLWAAE